MTTFAVTDPNHTLAAINYLLSNLDVTGGGGNVTLPGNVIVANTTSGIINNYGNTPGGNTAPYWFLYQWVNLRYGNSSTGSGFNTLPTNSSWFGVYNSQTSTASNNPADYTWTEIAGGFGTTKQIYYAAYGGRQISFVAANSAPSSSYVLSVANTAINLDTVTTAAGSAGERGAIAMAYVVTTGNPIGASDATLTGWFGAPRGNTIAPIGTGLTPPVTGDTAQFTYAAGVGTPTATYTFNGATWQPAEAQVINGDVIITGTLYGNAIRSNTITSLQIATDTITANNIAGNTITGDKIQTNTITGNLIQGNTIQGNSLIIGTVTNAEIANNTIVANNILNGTITATQIANGTITANNIQTGTLTTNLFTANTINGNIIAAGTITAEQIAANVLIANTVVSTGANIGNNSSQGFWLQGNTGNARFGNSVSIGNLLTVGSNAVIGNLLTVGANANIGNSLRVGNLLTVGDSASIGSFLSVGTGATIATNLKVGNNANIGGNLIIGANVNIGNNAIILNSLRVGNNANIGNSLTIGNNASIGGNLNVAGLITTGNLLANTVVTDTIVVNNVSNGLGNSATNVTSVANPTQFTYYTMPTTSTFSTILANQTIYVWAQVQASWQYSSVSSATTTLSIYADLIRTDTATSTDTVIFTQILVDSVVWSQTQPSAYNSFAIWSGFIDVVPTVGTYIYKVRMKWINSGGTFTINNLAWRDRSILTQSLKR